MKRARDGKGTEGKERKERRESGNVNGGDCVIGFRGDRRPCKQQCTVDHKQEDAAAYAPDRRCVCTHQTAALFCVK